jgi:hypothetical protein
MRSAVEQQDQAPGRLQHRHADAEHLQQRPPRPRAHQQNDQHGESALVGHAPLDIGREAPRHRGEEHGRTDRVDDREQGGREEHDVAEAQASYSYRNAIIGSTPVAAARRRGRSSTPPPYGLGISRVNRRR